MAWCLTKDQETKFRKALSDKKIDPFKLSEMTSKQRNYLFGKYLSRDNASQVNALFESKMLLKNQQRGYITWAKKIVGVTPQVRRDLISRIEKMDRVLDPKEGEAFLNDLVNKRLGVEVTEKEARNINKLTKKMQKAQDGMVNNKFKTESDRLNYGRAKIAVANYVNQLKLQAGKKTLKETLLDPVGALSDVAGNAKSIRASMDNSAIFRQGWKTLWTHPKVWFSNAKKTFSDIWKTFGKDTVMDELNADLVSRENALNGNYNKMKLALGTIEEEFPGSVVEKIPGVKKFYKASENAFTAFVYKQRADVADIYLKIAEASGVDLSDPKEMKSIGKMVNSLTGRGSVGKLEPAANVFNNVFWSPRKMKADIDTLTVHALDKDFSKFARKESAKNTLKVIVGTAAILAIAKAIDPDSVEEDPRSADFGKIKVGNTRFDVSAGMSSIIVLASRLITSSSKSSTTGKITDLNSDDWGAMSKKDVIYNFLENKLSPFASVMMDLLEGKDFDGNKITTKTVLKNLFVPLPIENYFETLQEPDHANMLAIFLADFLGVGTNTYSAKENWSTSTSKEMTEFREMVGEKELEKANKLFNKRYNDWLRKARKSNEYLKMSNDERNDFVRKNKREIKVDILDSY